MTATNITASDLLGKFVSFNETIFEQTFFHRGVVKAVCLNIEGDHEILLGDDFHKLSEITDLRVTGVLA